jgi:hypothetical protein
MATRLYSNLLGTAEDHKATLTTILTREPIVRYVVDLLNQLCLKNGVKMSVANNKPTSSFTNFFEDSFLPVLPHINSYRMYCGFVPWIVHTLPETGDRIPMLLPIGSFSWTVRTKDIFARESSDSFSSKRHKKSGSDKSNENQTLDHTCVCEYVVESTGSLGVRSSDIHVVNLLDPMMSNNNTAMGLVQYSPLYIAVQKYLALELAQQRRCYADDWNTTSRLFVTKHPPALMNERAGRDEVPFGTTRFAQASMPDGVTL